MQSMQTICEELFELSRHIKSVDRRTDRQTDRRTDRKCYYQRVPTFSMQGPNKMVQLYRTDISLSSGTSFFFLSVLNIVGGGVNKKNRNDTFGLGAYHFFCLFIYIVHVYAGTCIYAL